MTNPSATPSPHARNRNRIFFYLHLIKQQTDHRARACLVGFYWPTIQADILRARKSIAGMERGVA